SQEPNMHASFVRSAKGAVPVHAVPQRALKSWLERVAFLKASGFQAREGELRLVPGARGGISAAVLGLGKSSDSLALAAASEQLPEGIYQFGEVPGFCGGAQGALAWALGSYSFGRYKQAKKHAAKLLLPEGADGAEITRIA